MLQVLFIDFFPDLVTLLHSLLKEIDEPLLHTQLLFEANGMRSNNSFQCHLIDHVLHK